MVAYGFTDSGDNGSFAGGANYPGLGAPISAYGYEGGQMSMGPYAMLGTTSVAQSGAGQLSGGNQAAQGFLNGVLNGSNLPYGATQQAAMLGQSSAMNAASEAAQNKLSMANATAGGASPTDPSLQSSMAQNMAQRQNSNQNAAGNIAAQAGSANFNAQQGAAGGLLQNGIQQQELGLQAQGMANQQRNTAMGYLSGIMGGGRGGMGGGQGVMGYAGGAQGFSQPTGDGWGS